MNQIEQILDKCIADLSTGRVTVDECLARYPDLAETLEPLLRQTQLTFSQGLRERHNAALHFSLRDSHCPPKVDWNDFLNSIDTQDTLRKEYAPDVVSMQFVPANPLSEAIRVPSGRTRR